ncbi:carbon-nitrogen hydrolase family protein [Nocardia sp. NRRL S-836]|uniref:carbon-nitrogen hydrolase family protein n=1 Tax=Nocardia sp. NRRL S-836 TaxID=1519492 RepID=UPI0006AD9ED5|nr:carbon-nitrogen hydrolase family protein [Nocardia sp. NRRL S-836]KOV85277.1 carbon-nitrogen hydrolase [Nocardia sp. NRRL S-836]
MRIACWQAATHPSDVAGALARLRVRAEQAAAAGARVLVTPEMSLSGYDLGSRRLRELAEPESGPMCGEVARIASESGIAIVHGWPELAGEHVYNSVRLVDADGTGLATYRKTHLFGAIDRSSFSAGDTGVVQAVVDGLTIGLIICYDVEFPELVRAHALRGTELLVVPTALMSPWHFVAETLVPARACESQLFIAYTNWTGRERRLEYCGLTRVAGPDGRVVAIDAGTRDGLLVTDLDPSLIAEVRKETPYLTDRRPELY